MILNRVIYLLTRWRSSRKVVFEEIQIYHETDSAILVELEDQAIWLPKAEIEIAKENGAASIHVPIWLIRRKFPVKKYRQFSKY